MQHVRAVTFDCWGTLISDSGFDRAMAGRVRALSEACGIDEASASDLLDRAWREHHAAWLDAKQYGSVGMARFCTAELGISQPATCERLQEALEEAGRLGSQFALEGAVDSLRTLRAAGIRTALVCDAGFTPGRIVRDFLDEHGLLEHLEFCAFSNEVGAPKPEPLIFEAALDAIEARPEEAVHVGDLLRTDVYGARRLGMRTVRITQVADDASRGFSWDANADPGGVARRQAEGAAITSPYDDADEVVSSHDELPAALHRLGVPLGAN